MDLQQLRLLLVQATEPYRAGIENGVLNTEQLTVLEGLTTWGFQLQEVGILGCASDEIYDEILPTGVRVIGSGLSTTKESILKHLADFCPTHLVIDTAESALFRWATRQHIHCIGMFQETPTPLSLRRKWDNYQLSKALNHSGVDWVGALGVDQCETLASRGVLRDKLIPWDWPPSNRVETFEAKQLRSPLNPIQLIYVGPILTTRGIGDLLIAAAQLKAQGWNIHINLVGQGDIRRFEIQAKQLQLNHVEFIQNIPEHSLVHLIRQADVFVMPSRHESLENSNTILNHCFQAHTPIVTSDHPILADSLKHNVNAMIFPAGNTRALAQRIDQLLTNPKTYAQLSAASQTTWQSLQLPVHWISLIDHWLQRTTTDQQWLKQYSLKAPIYSRSKRIISPS
ncbi:MAG: glycosyltransferase [Cyanobacteria bacterium P01_H01_bin.21]